MKYMSLFLSFSLLVVLPGLLMAEEVLNAEENKKQEEVAAKPNKKTKPIYIDEESSEINTVRIIQLAKIANHEGTTKGMPKKKIDSFVLRKIRRRNGLIIVDTFLSLVDDNEPSKDVVPTPSTLYRQIEEKISCRQAYRQARGKWSRNEKSDNFYRWEQIDDYTRCKMNDCGIECETFLSEKQFKMFLHAIVETAYERLQRTGKWGLDELPFRKKKVDLFEELS